MGLEHATVGSLVLLALMIAPVLYYIHRARRGDQLYVRRIRAVDAIDEAVGRAAELGRPMSYTTSITGVGPLLYACLGILYHIGSKAALYRNKLLSPQSDPQVMAITEDVLRDAYRDQGRLSSFEPRNIQYLSDEQFAFAAGYMGLIQREQVASAFLFGSFAAESLILAEAGQQIGAMQVAGSVNIEQTAFFVCTCDYTLIGEELFAASSYLTNEPVQRGSLYGQDRAKLLIFCMIIMGVAIATYNSWATHSGSRILPTIESLVMG